MTSLSSILADGSFWLPKQASNLAVDSDWLFYAILYICTFFFAIVVIAKLVFIVKYRRRTPDDATPLITHNTTLEVIWTGIPLIIVLWIFYVGWKGFMDYNTPASDSYTIEVRAQKWNFAFSYPNGGTSDTLYVPYNKPVKLVMTSSDVLHAVYIPAFRVQRNTVPGRDTLVWFTATQKSPRPTADHPGGFSLFCTQYCGDQHSRMHTRVHVLDEEEFNVKLRELANPFKEKDPSGKERWVPYAKAGEKFAKSSGCLQCHSLDGAKMQGPTWKDLYKKDHKFAASNEAGYSLLKSDSDEKWQAYFAESIINPAAKIVDGYQNVMPSFASTYGGDKGTQKDERLRAMIEYIKTLGPDYVGPTINGKIVPKADVAPEMYDVAPNQENHPESWKAQQPAATAAPDAK